MSTNTYSDKEGNRFTTSQIESRIKKAALQKLNNQLLEFGYNFCIKCKRNDCKPIDVSHTISRKEAKETGNVSVLWDLDNLEILGRNCHKEKDKLDVFTKRILPLDTMIEVVGISKNKIAKKVMTFGEALKIKPARGVTYINYQLGFSEFKND